jgi:hypothetical protein
MARIVHFEIPADAPDRAIRFYEKVLDWKFQKWEGPQEYWLITTGPKEQAGINGGMLRRPPAGAPSAMTVNTAEVTSVDEIARRVKQEGGEVVMPKMAIPGVGWLIYCKDTEGNMFGAMQPDTSAK